MDSESLTDRIRRKAHALGFSLVGCAPVSSIPPQHFQAWLERQYQGQMAYLERNTEKRLDPALVLKGARSVLSVALDYRHGNQLPYDQADRGVISRYAAGEDYHDVLLSRLQELLNYIQSLAPEAGGKIYVDTGPVLDKFWAQRAGLGWLGKHTNLISRKAPGSWFFIGEILLDMELEYDSPATDHCGSCTRCIEACPTDAIVAEYVLDSRRCISYLTIELREDIPEQWRPAMGNLIYGCDICQDVCPWNRKAPLTEIAALAPRPENEAPRLRELARLTPEEFPQRFKQSPIKRTKWRGLMRNVAVAMGNSKKREMLPELINLLESHDAMLRRHAAWALLEIGGDEAVAAVRTQLAQENDTETGRVLSELLQTRVGIAQRVPTDEDSSRAGQRTHP